MAGHSKWAQIKRSKAVVDAKRGALFTRLAREIMVAARSGAEPGGNFQLRTAIEKARAAGVPNTNIERAIAKGSGQLSGEGEQFEAVRYEGYGPGGVAVLVEAFTDNRNRTAADLRLAFGKHGGNLGETGCVAYLFEQRSAIRLAPGPGRPVLSEELLLESLLQLEEQGGPQVIGYHLQEEASELHRDGPSAEVLGSYADLERLQQGLRQLGWHLLRWEHRWFPLSSSRPDDPSQLDQCLRMLEVIEALEDVRSVSCTLD
ncbi:MAG: YebC/PmpR family DNA-binding transcriptional regulator [Cyanobacteriota bacterium]|nr:YebC/PmpR family DNA-binding transcriptional regulator [Cyanobacteriota bacterium]